MNNQPVNHIVIGNNVLALIVAKLHLSLDIPFAWYRTSAVRCDLWQFEHPAFCRLYDVDDCDFLKKIGFDDDWIEKPSISLTRKSGQWVDAAQLVPTSDDKLRHYYQALCLATSCYYPHHLQNTLANAFANYGELRIVTSIDLNLSVITTDDGKQAFFERAIWCDGRNELARFVPQATTKRNRTKHQEQTREIAVVLLRQHMLEAAMPLDFSALFVPFRYKDMALVAFGAWLPSFAQPLAPKPSATRGQANTTGIEWCIIINEITPDHEEVAKLVRAFKRHLYKELGIDGQSVKDEKITYYPLIRCNESDLATAQCTEIARNFLALDTGIGVVDLGSIIKQGRLAQQLLQQVKTPTIEKPITEASSKTNSLIEIAGN